MERNEFLKICGGTCLGLIGMSALLQSCSPAYYAQASVTGKQAQISKQEFEKIKKGEISYRKFVLLKVADLNYPVIVNRFDENTYSALLLKCTHQGNTLAVSGNILTCSAHGSEFDRHGNVLQGPAAEKLTLFPVTTDEKFIYIQFS
ncbi:MAG: Rieske (2Fe-2S) protein [Bacteroidetes bacterium]|nr:Rieske (2Fe-2S) protein [Bacteroidota bacterium]